MNFKLFNRYWSKIATAGIAVDAFLLLAAAWIGLELRFWKEERIFLTEDFLWPRIVVFAAAIVLSLYLNGMYDLLKPRNKIETSARLFRSLTMGAMGLWALYYLIPLLFLGRGVLALALLVAAGSLLGWRLLLTSVLSNRLFVSRLLIVGTDEFAQKVARSALARAHLGYEVLGFLEDSPGQLGGAIVNPSVIGTTKDASTIAVEHNATSVVVAQRDSRGRLNLDSLLECKTAGIEVIQGAEFLEGLTGQLEWDEPKIRSWLIFSKGFVVSRGLMIIKRLIDLVAALVILVLALPVMIAVSVAIRLDSPGPVLYRQKRVGFRNRPFDLVKFRSMRADAEAQGVPQWASKKDPRITRIGRIMRRSRIDELPQLWNVFAGHMSLVGPRPERPEFVEGLSELSPLYALRHSVRPGLTGWAQIMAPYASTVEESLEKLRYDLYYIKHLSPLLDLSILASTIRIVLLGSGAH